MRHFLLLDALAEGAACTFLFIIRYHLLILKAFIACFQMIGNGISGFFRFLFTDSESKETAEELQRRREQDLENIRRYYGKK